MASRRPALRIRLTEESQQQIVLSINLGSEISDDEKAELDELLDQFVAVGFHGGFARAVSSPAQSSLELTARDYSDRSRPEFRLSARDLDYRCFQILRNLATSFSAQNRKIVSLDIHDHSRSTSGDVTSLVAPTWETEDEAYPPRSGQITFTIVEDDVWDYTKSRRCLIEFVDEIDSDIREEVFEVIRRWIAIVERGAFAPPVKGSDEAEVWEDVLIQYDDYSVELVLSLFEASEHSWDVLANLIQGFSDRSASVSEFHIE